MKKFTCFCISVLVLLETITFISASKILILAPVSGKSNRITYLPLIEELGKRGHQLTVLSPHKSSPPMKNVEEFITIPWPVMEKRMQKELNFNPFESKANGTDFNLFTVMNLFDNFCKEAYDLPVIEEILRRKYDVIIMQAIFNNCALGMVYRLGAPLILISPVEVAPFQVTAMGGHLPPSFNPIRFAGIPEEMNFFHRFLNFGINALFEAGTKLYNEPVSTAVYREKLGNDIPPAGEILANASLFFTNSHFSLSKPKPFLPDVIETGGLHSFANKPKPLPEDIEDFIKKGKDGFIFFSMGSNIRATDMPEVKRRMFLNVFAKLKQQILWKWESEQMPDLPSNVKLSKWLPQQDLLGHKDIKMFITHCGGGSTEEAIYNGVPVLGFPMFSDQPLNAKLLHSLGMIKELDWNKADERILENAILELLNDPKYKNNAQTISKIYKDRPETPLDRAVYWVEYVIRHDGAPHLRSASRKLNWIQYHSYDVISVYLMILLVILYLSFVTLRWIFKKTCCKPRRVGIKLESELKKRN